MAFNLRLIISQRWDKNRYFAKNFLKYEEETHKKDQQRKRIRHTAENFTVIRKIVLNLLKKIPARKASAQNASRPLGTGSSFYFSSKFNCVDPVAEPLHYIKYTI
jgi:hypothetical protein